MLPNQDLLEKTIGLLPKEGATEIAKFLEAQGINGIKENAAQCPIARWLQGELGVDADAHETIIVAGRICTAVNGPKAINIVDAVNTPPSIQHFIQKFDQGDFPQLIDRPEEAPSIASCQSLLSPPSKSPRATQPPHSKRKVERSRTSRTEKLNVQESARQQ